MNLQLTEDEQRYLIWDPGDYLEVLSGTLTISSKRQYQRAAGANVPKHTEVSFFFECTDPAWGTKEWHITMESDIPNGPALLLLYRRGSSACAFAMVSMVNRAWTHAMPFDTVTLIKESEKYKALSKGQLLTMAKGVAGGVVASMLTGGLAGKWGVKKATQSGFGSLNEVSEGIISNSRALLFRLSKNADQYWEGGGGAGTSGKL